MKRIYSIYLILILTVSTLLTACGSTDTPEKLPPVVDKKPSAETIPETESEILSFALSDTFQSLLDQFNEEHKAITFFEGDYSAYLGKNENPEIDPADFAGNRSVMPYLNAIVTLEQVTADMELYYELLRTQYAGYKYFGGDEAFRAAVDAIIEECSAMETITVQRRCQFCGKLRSAFFLPNDCIPTDRRRIRGNGWTNRRVRGRF